MLLHGSMPPDVHVRVVDLHKRYGDHEVLRGISFEAYRGCNNMIVGVSGSGKTVLLRHLLRLERPDTGRIEIDGQDIVPMDELALMPIRRKLGVVYQDSALLDSLTVIENVALALHEHDRRLPSTEVRARAEARLRDLDVLDAAEKLPGALSGGMRRRVAVARALVTEPELLVYDEPTRGLDPILSRSVDRLIDQTRVRFGVTSIVISHDLTSVLGIGQYVNVLREGRITWSSSVRDFVHSDDPEARAFLAASGVKVPPELRALPPSRLGLVA